jgi:hypothetical protein
VKRVKRNFIDNARDILNNKSNDIGEMKPYFNEHGKPVVSVFVGNSVEDLQDINCYREEPVTNAQLRYDEWRALDDAVIEVAEDRLVGFSDLRKYGLVHTLNNAMGTTVLTWEEMSDAMEAFISIDPVRRGNNDAVDFAAKHIPIPIIHSDFQISKRVLTESRNRGNGVDTINAERAARKVSEKLEDMLFGSTTLLTYGGGAIYTYLTHPDINTVSFSSAGEYWDASGKTAAEILADVVSMKQASLDDKHHGPWILYVPGNYETTLDNDYSTSGQSTQTIRDRILKIKGILDVVVVDKLADDTVLLVQMKKDTVDLVDGMPMQTVQWAIEGGFVGKYKVMTIQIPRVKSDYNNRSGIVKLS